MCMNWNTWSDILHADLQSQHSPLSSSVNLWVKTGGSIPPFLYKFRDPQQPQVPRLTLRASKLDHKAVEGTVAQTDTR